MELRIKDFKPGEYVPLEEPNGVGRVTTVYKAGDMYVVAWEIICGDNKGLTGSAMLGGDTVIDVLEVAS